MQSFLKEEKLIMDCLAQYECLRKEQLVQLLYNKERDIALKIVNGLQKRQYILIDKDSDKVKVDPRCEYSFKMEMAFWVLLKFIDKIKPEEHYAASYPSDIYFLKEGIQYEIVVIETHNDEYLLNIIAKNNQPITNTDEDDDYNDETKYIVVVPNEDMIPSCAAKLKDVQKIFAVYHFDLNADSPDIKFVKAD